MKIKNRIIYSFFILSVFFSAIVEGQEIVRFGVFADIHKDIMPDANRRLELFVEKMNRIYPDFIISDRMLKFKTK